MRRLLNILAIVSVMLYGGGVVQFAHVTLEHGTGAASTAICASGCAAAPVNGDVPEPPVDEQQDAGCPTCDFLATFVLSIDVDAAETRGPSPVGHLVAMPEARPVGSSLTLRRSRAPPVNI